MNRRAVLRALALAPVIYRFSPGLSSVDVAPERTKAVMVGSYVDLAGMSPTQARKLRTSQLGRPDRIVSLYYNWADRMPARLPDLEVGSIPMISWSGTHYADILNGSQDTLIRAAADALAAYGQPLLLRFAWEMNGYWFDWGGPNNASGAAGFIEAWRHVHDIFTAAGATNVAWVWCVNWNNNPATTANAGHVYYPGDAYVDWIAVDGFSSLTSQTPQQLFGAFYGDYAGRKPLMIAETAVSRPEIQADWIASLASWIKQRPDIEALVWFDTNRKTATGGRVNWRIDANPAELAAYRRMVNDPYFAG
jgi:glycosyl hydrolase family 26